MVGLLSACAPGWYISPELERDFIREIRMQGHPCAEVTSAREQFWEAGYVVYCNDDSYRYVFTNRQGEWEFAVERE